MLSLVLPNESDIGGSDKIRNDEDIKRVTKQLIGQLEALCVSLDVKLEKNGLNAENFLNFKGKCMKELKKMMFAVEVDKGYHPRAV